MLENVRGLGRYWIFCALIFPTGYYHLLFNGEDEDNDSSNILKCLLKAVLFYMHYII